jgi:uncharacterized spore protein YtfJ
MELEKPDSSGESPAKFIEGMAEKLGAVARAATIFGEPVERDGITVIPVAKARWGFGGGAVAEKMRTEQAVVAARKSVLLDSLS